MRTMEPRTTVTKLCASLCLGDMQRFSCGCINFDINITNSRKMNQIDAKNPPLIYSKTKTSAETLFTTENVESPTKLRFYLFLTLTSRCTTAISPMLNSNQAAKKLSLVD